MTLQATEFLPTKKYPFEKLRRMIQSQGMLNPGTVGPLELRAEQRGAGANMSVDVWAGDGWVEGTSNSRQGLYHVFNDATVNVGVFAAADATNPRVDQVILVVNDSSIIGTSDLAEFKIIAGTPAAGAQITNASSPKWREGAVSDATIKATSPNFIRLADVLVPAKATKIENANIQDRRQQANMLRQYLRQQTDTDYSGILEWTGRGANYGAGPFARFYAYITGAGVLGLQAQTFAKAGGTLYERTILNGEGGSSFLRYGAQGGNVSLYAGIAATTLPGVANGAVVEVPFTHAIGKTPFVMMATVGPGGAYESSLNVQVTRNYGPNVAGIVLQNVAGGPLNPASISIAWMAVVTMTT